MPVLNYTTKISAHKTIGEMQQMLGKAGASKVSVVWDGFGHVTGLEFTLSTPHGERQFSLPIDITAMHKLLCNEFPTQPSKNGKDQAERVATRVVKDWLAAQLALVEAQMASLDQVMLPYLHVTPTKTLYTAYKENETNTKLVEA